VVEAEILRRYNSPGGEWRRARQPGKPGRMSPMRICPRRRSSSSGRRVCLGSSAAVLGRGSLSVTRRTTPIPSYPIGPPLRLRRLRERGRGRRSLGQATSASESAATVTDADGRGSWLRLGVPTRPRHALRRRADRTAVWLRLRRTRRGHSATPTRMGSFGCAAAAANGAIPHRSPHGRSRRS